MTDKEKIQKEKIQEDNAVLVIFMGYKLQPDVWIGSYWEHKDEEAICFGTLNYHSSFDKLMPVARKFCSLPLGLGMEDFHMGKHQIFVESAAEQYLNGLNEITDIFNALVEGIKYYNEHVKSEPK